MMYPDNVKIVRYELLVRNFNHTIQSILAFIQLNANEYDYSAITRSSNDAYLSESTETPAFEDISYPSASGLKGIGSSTEKFTKQTGYTASTKPQVDDEINILPYRKLQVASPLFDGTGKAKYLSMHDKSTLHRNIIFSTMMNFMGYTIET